MVICEVVLGRGSRARDERETRGEEEQESEQVREGEQRPGKEEGSRVFSQRIDDFINHILPELMTPLPSKQSVLFMSPKVCISFILAFQDFFWVWGGRERCMNMAEPWSSTA